ncbi:MAG: hypothetical protein HY827_02830 [Actinobacteria bacterium]|nr:hypothetical protein [Actinomycetota bacterium]
MAEFLPVSLCPRSVPLLDDVYAATGSSDGSRSVRVDAVDTAGNVVPLVETRLGFDSTAPPKPSDVDFSGVTADLWTTHAQLTASWRNDGENLPSDLHSGLAKSWVNVDPLSGQAEDPAATSSAAKDSHALKLPSEGKWRISIWLEDYVGNISEPYVTTIGRDVDAPSPPQLQENSWVNRFSLEAGYYQRWNPPPSSPTNESGICGFAAEINSSFNSIPIPEITVDATDQALRVPSDTPSGTNYIHVRSISCAGLPSATVTTVLRIDGEAPTVELMPKPTGGWLKAAAFFRLRASDAASGVERIEYRIDDRPSVAVSSSDLSIGIGDGEHTIVFQSFDKAGNASESKTTTIRVDATSPTAFFLPSEPDDPTLVQAAVNDPVSGFGDGWIEIRRLDVVSPWRLLPTAAVVDRTGNSAMLSSAVDDDALPGGSYEMRVRTIDRAGNSNIVEVGSSIAAHRLITLPVRSDTTVTSRLTTIRKRCKRAHAKRCEPVALIDRAGAQTRFMAKYRRPVYVTGDLHDADGSALAGRTVSIYGSIDDGPVNRLLGRCNSHSDGTFEYKLPVGPSRRIVARFEGDKRTRSAQSQTTLGVVATTSFRANAKRVAWGKSVVFSGRLSSGGQAIGTGGKDVNIQFLSGAKQPVGVLIRSDMDGRFRLRYTFERSVDRPVRYQFRAAVTAAPGWPFLTGFSRVVSVTVTPR